MQKIEVSKKYKNTSGQEVRIFLQSDNKFTGYIGVDYRASYYADGKAVKAKDDDLLLN